MTDLRADARSDWLPSLRDFHETLPREWLLRELAFQRSGFEAG